MGKRAAFKFIGRLSEDVMRCAANISSGNVVCACIDAARGLLDMTTSIISYSEECKRTRILQEDMYESGILSELSLEQCRKNTESEIQKENELLVKKLDLMKVELAKEYEAVCLSVENEKKKLINALEYEKGRTGLVDKVRRMSSDTIKIATNTLEILNKDSDRNRLQIAGLEEQLRVSVAEYTKMIRECC